MSALFWSSLAFGGAVEGTIYDPDGLPVMGAQVVVYDQRLGYATTTTDGEGSFSIPDLPPNFYRLRVLPPMDRNLVEHWYPAGLGLCDGAPQVVDEVPVALSVSLEAGGQLDGRVIDVAGQPIPDLVVSVRSTVSGSTLQGRRSTTDEAGQFSLAGLALESGDYAAVRIHFEAEGWPEQFFGGGYQEDEGQVVTVYPDAPQDLGDIALLDGIGLAGTVRGPEGPVPAGTLYAYSPNQVVTTPFEEGRFETTGLPPGEVLVWAVAPGFSSTYYPDADRPGERIPVTAEGAFVSDVSLVLPRTSVITGRLTAGEDFDGDFSAISVLAYNDTRTVGFGGSVDEDGFYEVTGLHPGDYTLQVYGASQGFTDGVVTAEDGAPRIFSVGPEEDAFFEVPLTRGGVLRGTVVDLYSGDPVYGALVLLLAADVIAGEDQQISYAVTTDHAGAYEIPGIQAGTWDARIDYQAHCAPDPDWVRVHHPSVVNPVLSAAIPFASGLVVEWDAALPPDADHDGMDDVWEAEMGLDPDRDDADEDPDEDGFSNLEEYLLGTDPRLRVPPGGCTCESGAVGSRGVAWPWMRLGRRR